MTSVRPPAAKDFLTIVKAVQQLSANSDEWDTSCLQLEGDVRDALKGFDSAVAAAEEAGCEPSACILQCILAWDSASRVYMTRARAGSSSGGDAVPLCSSMIMPGVNSVLEVTTDGGSSWYVGIVVDVPDDDSSFVWRGSFCDETCLSSSTR